MRVMITGSAGFVGHHVVNYFLENTDCDIVGLDSFRHRGDSLRVTGDPNRYTVYCHDLNAPLTQRLKDELGSFDTIINCASLSHVDTSIEDPAWFWQQNTQLISNILEFARSQENLKHFIHCSTDEVFGAAPDGYAHHEWDVICPSNPYAASKAAQEALCIAYWRTFNVPVVITNTMNMIGTRQDPEKFLPKVISRVMKGEVIKIHGSHDRVGSRMYLDCRNLADAWLFLLKNHVPVRYVDGEGDMQRPSRFNIAGLEEIDNLSLAQEVATILDKPLNFEFEDFHKTRPGHDRRYALDSSKIISLGWNPPFDLGTTLQDVCDFMQENPAWLEVL